MVNTELQRDFTGCGIDEEGPAKDHGTAVAGVIGAQGDNGIGICGVCWDIKLVSLQVMRNTGFGYSSNVYRAISYAAQLDIPILNLSFGWSGDDIEERYDAALYNIISSYPGLVVCSAGNEDRNNDTYTHYPSNYRLPNLIAVGASTQSNARWVESYTLEDSREGSNYGSWSVDVFAPGHFIQTTYPGNLYTTAKGTSLAAPYVSGIAALILSLHPNLSGAELKEIITNSIDVCTNLTEL